MCARELQLIHNHVQCRWGWSGHCEDLFDLRMLLTEWSGYWMPSTGCVYIFNMPFCSVLNRMCFRLALIVSSALSPGCVQCLSHLNNQCQSAERALPQPLSHISLTNWFSCTNVIHKGTQLSCKMRVKTKNSHRQELQRKRCVVWILHLSLHQGWNSRPRGRGTNGALLQGMDDSLLPKAISNARNSSIAFLCPLLSFPSTQNTFCIHNQNLKGQSWSQSSRVNLSVCAI